MSDSEGAGPETPTEWNTLLGAKAAPAGEPYLTQRARLESEVAEAEAEQVAAAAGAAEAAAMSDPAEHGVQDSYVARRLAEGAARADADRRYAQETVELGGEAVQESAFSFYLALGVIVASLLLSVIWLNGSRRELPPSVIRRPTPAAPPASRPSPAAGPPTAPSSLPPAQPPLRGSTNPGAGISPDDSPYGAAGPNAADSSPGSPSARDAFPPASTQPPAVPPSATSPVYTLPPMRDSAGRPLPPTSAMPGNAPVPGDEVPGRVPSRGTPAAPLPR